MIGHLGARVSALLDGQMPPDQAEEAWRHVYTCHLCRDRVEREGWVKVRLAGLSTGEQRVVPDHLVGSLRSLTPGEQYGADPGADVSDLDRGSAGRRAAVAVGGGAAGAAVLGILALGLVPASTTADRRPPAPADIGVVQPTPVTAPSPRQVAVTQGPTRPVVVEQRATAVPTESATTNTVPVVAPR